MAFCNHLSRQEFDLTLTKGEGTMAEKRVQLHFPLERIAEPIVTRLVTDYDLEPNLLRADVDATTGGWMVVGLTGTDERLGSALSWLRGQGLAVTEVAEG
jgi:ABC-type methionine transport system ATPase subunit